MTYSVAAFEFNQKMQGLSKRAPHGDRCAVAAVLKNGIRIYI